MSQKSKAIIVNIITLVRILGIPFIFVIENKFLLFVFVNLLFITDFIDGYLARKFDVASKLGGFLDLIADKTIVIVLLIVALVGNRLSLLVVTLIIIREIISMVIRYINNKETGETIPPSIYGKSKTTLQFVAFDFMILELPLYHLLFWLVIILGYFSLGKYIKVFLNRKDN